MRRSPHTTASPDSGFTLMELLVSVLVAGILLAGFTSFYLSEQRALKHHQVEIEASQQLRTALEQMSRDLRASGRNLGQIAFANFPFQQATSNTVEFYLDSDNSGTVNTSDPNEHKGFRLNGTNLQQLDAPSNWVTIASNVAELQFRYYQCDGTSEIGTVTPPGTEVGNIVIKIRMTLPVVGGLPVDRTETERVQLRNNLTC